jgi:hypothetical protein
MLAVRSDSLIFVSLDRMRLSKLRYAALAGAIVGLAVPLLVYALQWLNILGAVGYWLLFIWPSAIMLSGDSGDSAGNTPIDFAVLAFSVLCNILVYVIVFTLPWSLAWLRTWRAPWNHDLTRR